MGRNRGLDDSPGRFNRKIEDLKKEIAALRSEKRLAGSTFPAGVVPTSALVDPNVAGLVQLDTSNFATTTAGAHLITYAVPVPAGMTAAVVSLTGRVYAVNSTATADYLYARVEVGAIQGTAVPAHAAGTGSTDTAAFNVATLTTLVAGLMDGDTVTVRLWARTNAAAWAASASNVGDLSGTVGWLS